MNDEELLEEYFCLLRRRCRPSNYYATKSSVKKFVRHVREQGLGLREVRPRDAQAYQGELLAAGCGKSHVTTLMTKTRAFYEYLKREKMVSSNPFYDVVRIRREEKLPRYIPKEKELEGFLAKLARFEGSAFRGWVSYRAHVASELLYATGMRIGEAARLTVADVDLDKGTVRVRESKNGRSRVCFLSEYARAVIRLYLEKARPVLAREWGEKKQAVLFGMNECVLPETVNAVLVKTAHEAGLPKITCHTFRHAFGSHLLRSGCDIRFIQTLLGHEWLSTTQVYTKVEKEDLRDVLDKCHPRHFVRGRTGERAGELMKLNLCAVLVVYKKEMASAGLGAKEVCRRLADTEEFAEWLKERYGIADFREVERRQVKEYLAHLEAKVKPKTGDHLRRETVKSKLTALRMLFRSLAREELILSNPCEEVEYKVRRDDGRRVVLSEEEMARLLDMAGDDNPAGLRDRAMFELMYSSGLRCAEVVKLAVTDVDFERRFVMIRNAKFGRDRVVPMTEAAAAILAKYLETAGRLREEPVFPGGAGGRMSPLTVWKRFRRLLIKAGLVKPLLSPHSIRHSTATHLLEHGAGVRQVQELLGHSCIQTTVGYTHMLTESLKRIYKTHHPGENACFREVDDEYRRSVERLIGAMALMKREHRRRKGGSGTG